MAPELYLQRDQPPGVPPLALDGERTLPDVPEENYWFQRHVAVYAWVAAQVSGRRVIDMASGEGYGADLLARTRRRSSGSRPTRTPSSTPACATRAERPLRAQHGRGLRRAVRRDRVPADDRARAGPRRGARALRGDARARRCRVRLDAERAHARAARRRSLRQPVARARVPRRRSSATSARRTSPTSSCSASTTRASSRPPARDRPARAGTRVHARLGLTRASTTASCLRSPRATSRCARARPRPRARPRGGAPPVTARPAAWRSSCTRTCPTWRASGRGRSARSGCGRRSRRPTCRCSACSTAARRVTLSLTPVLCDQLEAPGAMERCRAFLADVRPASHRLDAEAARAAGDDDARPRARARRRRLRARPRAAAGRPDRGARARTPRWTSAATHAILPLLATDAAVRLQVAHRHRRPPRALRARGAAASGCRSARTRRGSTRCSRRRASTPSSST